MAHDPVAPLSAHDRVRVRSIRWTAAKHRILDVLERRACDMRVLCELAGVAPRTLSNPGYLPALRRARLVHVCGWLERPGVQPAALYRAGPGPDVPYRARSSAERLTPLVETVLADLRANGPADAKEMAARTGRPLNSIRSGSFLRRQLELGRIHIHSWRRNHPGPLCPVFAAGHGENAPRPAPLSRAERNRLAQHRELGRRATSNDSGAFLSPLLVKQLRAASNDDARRHKAA